MGNGFGGLAMKCRADGNLRHLKPNKVQIYTGDWVRNLKAQGMETALGCKESLGASAEGEVKQQVTLC